MQDQIAKSEGQKTNRGQRYTLMVIFLHHAYLYTLELLYLFYK